MEDDTIFFDNLTINGVIISVIQAVYSWGYGAGISVEDPQAEDISEKLDGWTIELSPTLKATIKYGWAEIVTNDQLNPTQFKIFDPTGKEKKLIIVKDED